MPEHLLVLRAPFSVFCMYIIYVQATGRCSRPQDLQEHCSPDTDLHWDPTPCSSFLRGNSLLWSLGWAIAVTALSPGSSSDPHCTSESRWYHPHREQEEAGPRVQEHGHVPCLGRTVRGGASVCFQPLSCIQVELIGREDTRCPVPGGSEASTWCFCSTAVLGPGQCTCLPGAQVMRLSVATCCPVPRWERRAGVCAARTCPPPRT